MAYKKSRKRGNSRSFYKKNKSRIVNDFLELAAKELKEVEDKMIKDVLKEGVGQRKTIVFGFIELQVRPGRNGEVIVKRKLDEKALMKAILKRVEEIKERTCGWK